MLIHCRRSLMKRARETGYVFSKGLQLKKYGSAALTQEIVMEMSSFFLSSLVVS